jgi:hypothetical protein
MGLAIRYAFQVTGYELRDLFLVASKILETKIWKELEMPALQL